jgi:hypothetical protein
MSKYFKNVDSDYKEFIILCFILVHHCPCGVQYVWLASKL